MNKKTYIVIATVITMLMGAHYALSSPKKHSHGKQVRSNHEHVTLEAKNSVSLRLPFTASTVDTVIAQLVTLSHGLDAGAPIYLYMDTPGGDIGAGERLISAGNALPNPIITISNFAASMGFMTAQSASGARLVTPNGILMAHRATMGSQGQVPGEFNTRAKFFQDSIESLEKVAASRMGLAHADYQKLVKDEYWVQGQNAVDAGAADAVVDVSCGADLKGTSSETLNTFFGPVEIIWSACPLITNPIGFKLPGANYSVLSYVSSQDIVMFNRVMSEVLTDKTSIVDNEALSEAFFKYAK